MSLFSRILLSRRLNRPKRRKKVTGSRRSPTRTHSLLSPNQTIRSKIQKVKKILLLIIL